VKAFEFQQARRALGLTQKKMADAIGVNDRTIRYYETGRVPVSPTVAVLVGLLVILKEQGKWPMTTPASNSGRTG
jgi:DNA-binding XRE family transcriptional regulator